MVKDDQKTPLCEAIQRFGRNRPQCYRILVQGKLDPGWSDRLAGLRIQMLPEDESTPPISVLEGLVVDQAQLSGVLNTLCELRLPLLAVELIKKAKDSQENPDNP